MDNPSIEKQIDDYLSQLNISQKEAVLHVVKTIAEAASKYENIWDEDFEKEMDRRIQEYEKGTAKLYKFEEMKNVIVAKYKENTTEKLVKEYADSIKENNQITKDFTHADKENWNDY